MRYLLCCLCSLMICSRAVCQLGVGTGENLYIPNGVTFSVDSLVMVPSTPITISNNNLTHHYNPVPGIVPGTNSIARVYVWDNAINYAGELGKFYHDAELAGNTEPLLQIIYNGNGGWVHTTSSTVNPTSNFVNHSAVNDMLNMVTAAQGGTILPITYTSFSAAMKDRFVQLDWKMDDTDGLTGFEVMYSDDTRNWRLASAITASEGTKDYSFRHYDLNFNTRHYRIAMLENTGARVYTNIVTVRNNTSGTNMRVVKNSNGLLLYFNGTAPSDVMVYDMKGQLLQASRVTQQPVGVSGLNPGAYIIHYVSEGKKISRVVYY